MAAANDTPPPLMVPVADVRKLDPSWPWELDSTYALIRTGKLGCVRVGKRVFLRREDLEAFVVAHATGTPKAG